MTCTRRIAVSALAVALTIGGTAAAQGATAAKDPLLGTWKENLAKSTYDPASFTPKTQEIVRREVSGANGFRITVDRLDPQGAVAHTEYVAKLDGKDYPAAGSPDYDAVAMKRLDANTLIMVNKKRGAVVRMIRTTVSNDGKTSTTVAVGYNARGVAFHTVTVLEKQ
jgi:hypothetical protein